MVSYFNRFSISMTKAQALSCSHQGDCEEDVIALIKSNKVKRSKDCTVESLRAELKEYGAWTDEDLQDDSANWQRIVWSAACNIKEDLAQKSN